LHAAAVAYPSPTTALSPNPKQNVPIPFNKHQAFVLQNPKTGLIHCSFELIGRGFDQPALLRRFRGRGRQV
jgi:hypothetical protein